MTKSLSPAAQAVVDAAITGRGYLQPAVADQVVPDEPDYIHAAIHDQGWWDKQDLIRSEILAITAEMEGAQ